MLVTVNGKRWKLGFHYGCPYRGQCDAPGVPGKQIRIDKTLDGEEQLEVLIHELLHAGCWHLDEESVETVACDIARILWRLGYRRN